MITDTESRIMEAAEQHTKDLKISDRRLCEELHFMAGSRFGFNLGVEESAKVCDAERFIHGLDGAQNYCAILCAESIRSLKLEDK